MFILIVIIISRILVLVYNVEKVGWVQIWIQRGDTNVLAVHTMCKFELCV